MLGSTRLLRPPAAPDPGKLTCSDASQLQTRWCCTAPAAFFTAPEARSPGVIQLACRSAGCVAAWAGKGQACGCSRGCWAPSWLVALPVGAHALCSSWLWCAFALQSQSDAAHSLCGREWPLCKQAHEIRACRLQAVGASLQCPICAHARHTQAQGRRHKPLLTVSLPDRRRESGRGGAGPGDPDA